MKRRAPAPVQRVLQRRRSSAAGTHADSRTRRVRQRGAAVRREVSASREER